LLNCGLPRCALHSRDAPHWIAIVVQCTALGLPAFGFNYTGHPMNDSYVEMLNNGTIRITDISRLIGHTYTQMQHARYVKFIKSEEVKINQKHNLFGHNLDTVKNESLDKSLKTG
jgi:hypothetical protein